jgi:predicted membrane protein
MKKNNEIKIGSNRSFGIVFFVVFLLVAIWPILNNDSIRIWSIIICLIFLFLGIIKSKYLTPLNKLWSKFGVLLGTFVSPFVMGLIFFVVLTPIAIIMRILGKDVLKRKFNKNEKSYWIYREKNKGTLKNQF